MKTSFKTTILIVSILLSCPTMPVGDPTMPVDKSMFWRIFDRKESFACIEVTWLVSFVGLVISATSYAKRS
ncbi:hypothetical protein EKK58_06785 [Candidatus Dependentiae bacterium]|nr:MAG: hypothetical protein EKK58_06785 [Candidatus Dependentiae bacterium]